MSTLTTCPGILRARATTPAGPLVIAHRGASGYRPEHTLAAYELGARMGADYLEPDLVSTQDGVLVARHENELSLTTDVAEHPDLADRRTRKVIDGAELEGWFTEDLTLAELKRLRARERTPLVRQANTVYDGRYAVATFDEILRLARRMSRSLGREIGVCAELKHATYFRSIGLPLEPRLAAALRDAGLDGAGAKVIVQSFESEDLKWLRETLPAVPLVQLLDQPGLVPADGRAAYAEMATRDGLRAIATYADGVGAAKGYLVPRDADGRSRPATTFVADAHAAGLRAHAYTFRNENAFLPAELRSSGALGGYGDARTEYATFFALGVDAVYTDAPDTAGAARLRWALTG